MTKETWLQFAERIKPEVGQMFQDERGYFFKYDKEKKSFNYVGSEHSIVLAEMGSLLSCTLVDAIDHVEPAKLKKITYYCYLNMQGFFWCKNSFYNDTQALDENGNRITQEVWVIDNE